MKKTCHKNLIQFLHVKIILFLLFFTTYHTKFLASNVPLQKNVGWSSNEDSIVDILRQSKQLNDQDVQQRLRPLVAKCGTNVNAWHAWRDAQTNLLFHCSMEDCLVGTKMLLEKVGVIFSDATHNLSKLG